MAKSPKTLDDLFHDTLKDIYYAEKKILAALPKPIFYTWSVRTLQKPA